MNSSTQVDITLVFLLRRCRATAQGRRWGEVVPPLSRSREIGQETQCMGECLPTDADGVCSECCPPNPNLGQEQ